MFRDGRFKQRCAVRSVVGALGLWIGFGGGGVSAAGGLAGLYAEQPPAGSVFVRLLNPATPVQVAWTGGKPTALPLAGNLATAYRVMDPAKRPELSVNGKPMSVDKINMSASYATWVVSASGPDVVVIVDESPPANALKVVLRITNLVPDCQVTLKTAEGANVVEGLPVWQSKARAINPVKASLIAQCGAVASAPYVLPSLQAGDRFSVFVYGTARGPLLSGQIDATEAYSAKP
ncbi:MAG TPA: alginate O-acetyltransferase AlgF [Burkholderiaceae bacterium]|nr:alginate O-acetyltransferase AlgF [Burkholderiaceae bacterium]